MEIQPASGIVFIAQPVWQRERTLTIGNTLRRKRNGYPNEPAHPRAIVRDVITEPAGDSSEYVAVLCEGLGEVAGKWFVWRTYSRSNRHGRLCFGQFGPQAPLSVEKWISTQIVERGWYDKLTP